MIVQAIDQSLMGNLIAHYRISHSTAKENWVTAVASWMILLLRVPVPIVVFALLSPSQAPDEPAVVVSARHETAAPPAFRTR
mmetsp:Transcript_40023/g.65522  ORF Transcript_40023/g.65522 Transcript_40023/m.65522 type:complete len:82 (-) Transcript_40023:917-1162(-)